MQESENGDLMLDDEVISVDIDNKEVINSNIKTVNDLYELLQENN